MGLLTLQNYRDDLGATTPGALQRSNVGTALIDRWVNQAVKEFGYAFRFHELEVSTSFSTAVGVQSYAIGVGLAVNVADFRYVEEVRAIDPDSGATYRIRPETRSKYLRNIGVETDVTTYGTPAWYHKYSNKLFLRPTPAAIAVVTMDYYRTLTPFVAAGDVSPFHEDWDEVIFVGALYRGFRHFGEFDRYQNVRNDFLGLVRSRQTEYELEEFPDGGISGLGPDDTETSQEAL